MAFISLTTTWQIHLLIPDVNLAVAGRHQGQQSLLHIFFTALHYLASMSLSCSCVALMDLREYWLSCLQQQFIKLSLQARANGLIPLLEPGCHRSSGNIPFESHVLESVLGCSQVACLSTGLLPGCAGDLRAHLVGPVSFSGLTNGRVAAPNRRTGFAHQSDGAGPVFKTHLGMHFQHVLVG